MWLQNVYLSSEFHLKMQQYEWVKCLPFGKLGGPKVYVALVVTQMALTDTSKTNVQFWPEVVSRFSPVYLSQNCPDK